MATLYSAGIIYILSLVHLTTDTIIKDAAIWFAGSAFVILMRANKAAQEPSFFKDILVDNLKFTLVFEFVVNIHTFSLPTELVLIPSVIFFAALKAFADLKAEYIKVSKLMNGIFGIITLILLIYSLREISLETDKFLKSETIKSFLLPIMLTIGFIPVIYLIALIMEYEMFFVTLGFKVLDRKDFSAVKRYSISKSKFRLSRIRMLYKNIHQLNYMPSRDEFKQFVQQIINQ